MPRRILLVDDTPDLLVHLQSLTRECLPQWIVQSASSAEQAFNLLTTTDFDIVVSDAWLDEISGGRPTGVAVAWRAKNLRKTTEVLIVSCHIKELQRDHINDISSLNLELIDRLSLDNFERSYQVKLTQISNKLAPKALDFETLWIDNLPPRCFS